MPAVQNVMRAHTSLGLLLQLLITLWPSHIDIIAANEGYARIVGGTPAHISSAPYLVNLRHNNAFTCGGSLISTTHVVTAAHCVKGLGAKSLLVVGGATYLSDAGIRRTVQKIITPKAYSARTLHTDVAVLKLTSAMNGANVATIALCSSQLKVGEQVKVSGWGKTAENAQGSSNQLRSVDVTLMARTQCTRQYRIRGTITNTMFCATVPGQNDACDGDSGGPAVYAGQLCGIVSWGVGCARRNYPGVYTNIKTVKTFIDNAIKL